jgi:endonuclease/exonuclease/phosphatase family metal-dependent hydrolase
MLRGIPERDTVTKPKPKPNARFELYHILHEEDECHPGLICLEEINTETENLRDAAKDMLVALEELLADTYLSDPINTERMAKSRNAVAKAKGLIAG